MLGTILNHLALAAEAGEEIDLTRFLTAGQQAEIDAAFLNVGWQNIVGAREKLAGRYGYELLRIYQATRLANPATTAAGVTRNTPAQAVSRELSKLEVDHTLDLFDGAHGGIAYRYPGAIRELILALR